MPVLLVVAAVLLVGGAALASSKGRTVKPWPLSRLERSDTAAALGIDNSIPPHLLTRARGLAWAAAALEAAGVRVTSAHRSAVLNWAIYNRAAAERGERGTRPGDHVELVALDAGGDPGPDTRERLELEEQRVRGSAAGAGVERVVYEGDHLHVRFNAAWLEAKGRELEGVA